MRKPLPLRNLRRTRLFNQADFARHIGISQQSVSKIERGVLVPSIDVQDLIAAALGVGRKDLFPEKVA